jgi:hypothetical protein
VTDLVFVGMSSLLRHTEATLGELSEWLGVSRALRFPNLTRRSQARLKSQPELLNDVEQILRRVSIPMADHRQITPETPKSRHPAERGFDLRNSESETCDGSPLTFLRAI